jgi:hypothetical protein
VTKAKFSEIEFEVGRSVPDRKDNRRIMAGRDGPPYLIIRLRFGESDVIFFAPFDC